VEKKKVQTSAITSTVDGRS